MRFFARFCVPLVFSAVLFGQTRLTLADAVAQALAGNPRLAVASARVGVAEGLRKQAGLAPNPRLILQLENTRFWEKPVILLSTRHSYLRLRCSDRGNRRKTQSQGRSRD